MKIRLPRKQKKKLQKSLQGYIIYLLKTDRLKLPFLVKNEGTPLEFLVENLNVVSDNTIYEWKKN